MSCRDLGRTPWHLGKLASNLKHDATQLIKRPLVILWPAHGSTNSVIWDGNIHHTVTYLIRVPVLFSRKLSEQVLKFGKCFPTVSLGNANDAFNK